LKVRKSRQSKVFGAAARVEEVCREMCETGDPCGAAWAKKLRRIVAPLAKRGKALAEYRAAYMRKYRAEHPEYRKECARTAKESYFRAKARREARKKVRGVCRADTNEGGVYVK